MSADERLLELQERVRGNRSNAVICRNTALDIAKRIERDISDIRRKLEHDEVEDLADGSTIGYSSLFDSGPFNLERNLVRIVHFIGEMKVAQHDIEELKKEAALASVADRPGPVLRAVGREPAFKETGHTFERKLYTEECKHCSQPAEAHAQQAEESTAAEARDPWIAHGFIPQEGAHRFCAAEVEGKDQEVSPCGHPLEAHKFLDDAYGRCGLPREAHSIHPSPVDGIDSPHGHDFVPLIQGDSKEAWQNCQAVVKVSVEDRRPDPRSHRFQGGNGSKCTYSSYGVECQGTRRDHELM